MALTLGLRLRSSRARSQPFRQDYIGEQQLHFVRMTAEGQDRFGRVSRLQHTIARQAQGFANYLPNQGFIFH